MSGWLIIFITLVIVFGMAIIMALCTTILAGAMYPNSRRWLDNVEQEVFQEAQDDYKIWKSGKQNLVKKVPAKEETLSERAVGILRRMLRRTVDLIFAFIWMILLSFIMVMILFMALCLNGKGTILKRVKICGYRNKSCYVYNLIYDEENSRIWDKTISKMGFNGIFYWIPLLSGNISIFGLSRTHDINVSEMHRAIYDNGKPGIINLALLLRCTNEFEKFLCDVYYLEHKSFLFDFHMAMSVFAMTCGYQKENRMEVKNISEEKTNDNSKNDVCNGQRLCPYCGLELPDIKNSCFCPYCGKSIIVD